MIHNFLNSPASSSNDSFNKFILCRNVLELKYSSARICQNLRTILHPRKTTNVESDSMIIEDVENYFYKNNTKFNIYSIFNRAFENSYSTAVMKYSMNQKNLELDKKIVLLQGFNDSDSNFSIFPKEIIYLILKINGSLLNESLALLSCKDFQVHMWNFIVPIEDEDEIIKQFRV